jgi:hypothetical protein
LPPASSPQNRALAALLKDLHKRNLGGLACELFDWLRGLHPSHEAAHLLDVYTYTTMIVREPGFRGGSPAPMGPWHYMEAGAGHGVQPPLLESHA